MKKSLQMSTKPHTLVCGSDGSVDHVKFNQCVALQTKHITLAKQFEKKEHTWYPTSHIPTDITIQVQDITFYVHKYPLVAKCEYINRLDKQSIGSELKLENFPGGSETFEIILKFCYGLPVELTPTNVAPLRCAAEFLQMTEEHEEGNLVSKTEAFLTYVVLSSWRDCVMMMKSCESLSTWADNLQIIRRCSDSIASKITRKSSTSSETANNEKWWFDDVSTLRIDHFVRIITAVKARGARPEIIGGCIMHYSEKWLPANMMTVVESRDENQIGSAKNELQLSILSGRREEGSAGHNKDYRMMIETLVSILPPQREAVSCKFLLWMLKMALVYSVTPALVSELEKRIGIVLEEATVDDLLIPSYRSGIEGMIGSPKSKDKVMHDVDVVRRIVEYFLIHEQRQQQQKHGKQDVGKLMDGYLAEIAGDPNLSINKFQILVEAMPENARICHDGLYRAIDTYLKTHPNMTEHDRRRLCKAMDCDKLSLDACMHAAQNDRLPLRTVIQVTVQYKVLYSEQEKMRASMEEKKSMTSEIVMVGEEGNWSSNNTKNEIKTIKADLENVRTVMAELQHDYSELQKEFLKLNNHKCESNWKLGWKKIKSTNLFHGKLHSTDEKSEKQHGQTTPVLNKDYRRRRQSIS